MVEIQLRNHSDACGCTAKGYACHDWFAPCSIAFRGGVIYALLGGFGSGSWAMAGAVAGKSERDQAWEGKIYYNGRAVRGEELLAHACIIGSTEQIVQEASEGEDAEELCAKLCIERGLKKSGIRKSVEEIKAMFDLTDARFERPIQYVGIEGWRMSLAIGYARGKTVYCYPWIGERGTLFVDGMVKYLKLLRDCGCIIVIPTSQKGCVAPICDEYIRFKLGRIRGKRHNLRIVRNFHQLIEQCRRTARRIQNRVNGAVHRIRRRLRHET